MDHKLLRRVQALGAFLVATSYFLPWASIVSPFGTIQMRALYIDYAWLLLLLAILHIVVQFAEANGEALAIPEQWSPAIRLIHRVVPFLMLAFLAWYGSQFAVSAHLSSGREEVNLFGTAISSALRAGLDYGYWIGLIGAAVLLIALGLSIKRAGQFGLAGVVIALASFGAAFGVAHHGKQVNAISLSTTHEKKTAAPVTEAQAEPTPSPEPELDASPYVEVSSITGHRYGKDIQAGRYSNTVVISPVFKNVGPKTIVGLQGRMSVLDGFGNEVYGFNFRADNKLTPARESSHTAGYEFEDNQFINDEPYDKIAPLIAGGTAKYSAKIKRIAFDDGTVLPEKK
jgi:hypothetical protein